MLDDWGSFIFATTVVIFFGWFVVGMQWNIRKGNAALQWLRDGLPLIGEKSTMRWLGSSVVEMKIAKAKDPFRTAETLVVLEPRDISFLWAYARWRGRRDLLIFRAQLRTAPMFEMETFDPKAWRMADIERDVTRKNWTRLESRSPALHTYVSGAGAEKIAQLLMDLAERAGGQLVQVAVHRTVPNLEIHWRLPDPKASSSRDWFSNLLRIEEIFQP